MFGICINNNNNNNYILTMTNFAIGTFRARLFAGE